tara:strand:+ start:117 stop:272 length:156 start_codon:yes stop_codon:yes gene_type:complete
MRVQRKDLSRLLRDNLKDLSTKDSKVIQQTPKKMANIGLVDNVTSINSANP